MLYAQRNNIPAVVPVQQSEAPALDCLVHGHEWKQEGTKQVCTYCGTGVDVGPSSTSARAAAEEVAAHLFATIFHPAGEGGISQEREAAIAAIIERHCSPAR